MKIKTYGEIIKKAIAKKDKALRDKGMGGYTQADLAVAVGMREQAINRIIKGHTKTPHRATIKLINKELEL